MIIRRYFTSELVKVLMAVTTVLLLISLSNKFVILMTRAASGDLSLSILFKVLGYYIPDLLAFILPLSLFMSILLVMGRLYVEREMTVLSACGMPWSIVMRPIYRLSIVVALFVGAMTTWFIPLINVQKEKVLGQEESAILLQTVAPERFQSLQGGKLVFYVEKVSQSKRDLQGIFIAEQPNHRDANQAQWSVLTAQHGEVMKKEGLSYLVLQDGVRYEGKPGRKDYTEVMFGAYARLVDNKPKEVPLFHRVTPTSELFKKPALGYKSELQWRLSVPLSTFILAIIAVPLSRVSPRQGRYAKLLPSIIVYIVYYNLLTISKRYVESGDLPVWIGVWWVHLGALGFGLYLWAQELGWQHRKARTVIREVMA